MLKPIQLAERLWPINRSLTGKGVRKTLEILNEFMGGVLQVKSVASGYKAFDWVVPDEWAVNEAYVADIKGNKIIDFKDNNLHLVGYSIPFEGWVSREELEKHLHTSPENPKAIPYVTTYYERNWGFCISYDNWEKIKGDKFYVKIDASLFPGQLDYGEVLVKGTTEKEIFFSTYICHPSMANNELSGPIVGAFIFNFLNQLNCENRLKYSYRIVFIPETIGSLVYMSKNMTCMKKNIIAGLVLTCLGDEGCFSYLSKGHSKSMIEETVEYAFNHYTDKPIKKYGWECRGSDERQYCSPNANLPFITICRSKFGTYPEYHTSLDNLNFISDRGLTESINMIKEIINILEKNETYISTIVGEPHLKKYKLIKGFGTKDINNSARNLLDVHSRLDGRNDILTIARETKIPFREVLRIILLLCDKQIAVHSEITNHN